MMFFLPLNVGDRLLNLRRAYAESLKLRRYEFQSLLRAEDTVHEANNVRMGHSESLLSVVRCADFVITSPLIPEALGYFRPSASRTRFFPRDAGFLNHLRQNPHRLMHLFIGIKEMWRHAQADTGTTINKNFSLVKTLDHPGSVLDVNHH